MTYIPKSKKWFVKRIGKTIYRDDVGCCKYCRDVVEHGLIVSNELHAGYLADIDAEYGAESVYCNYRDTKDEMKRTERQ